MKIVAIGNPPYQEMDGSWGKSSKPIYHWFFNALKNNSQIKEIIFIIPNRWQKVGIDTRFFRADMISSCHIKNLINIEKSKEVFPQVNIMGGINIIYYDKNYFKETKYHFDIILNNQNDIDFVNNVLSNWHGPWVSEFNQKGGRQYEISSSYFKKNKEHPNGIPCLTRGKVIKFIDPKRIDRQHWLIPLWKVMIAKACAKPNFFLLEPGIVYLDTYVCVQAFTNKKAAEKFLAYMQTDFVQRLIMLRKPCQHIYVDTFKWVPYKE